MKSIGSTSRSLSYELTSVEFRSLSCKLTSAELQALGGELAQAVQDRANEESRQLSLKAEMKARVAEVEARVTRLALVLSRGEDYRNVRVGKTLLDDGMVRETREDTGEIISTRSMREEERQLAMYPGAAEFNCEEPAHMP